MRAKTAAILLLTAAVGASSVSSLAQARPRHKVWVCDYSRGAANRGTLIGGLGGAALGSAVAGHGAKTEGAVLGGVVGAVAGHQVAKHNSQRKNCHYVWR